jgi:hypothetical protein
LCIHNPGRLRREEAANHPWESLTWRGRNHHLFFCEMSAPTMDSIVKMILVNVAGIDKREPRYLIGATKKGQDALQADPEQPLGVEDLVFLRTDEHVRVWVMTAGGPDPSLMDLLLVLRRFDEDERASTPERGMHRKLPRSLFKDAVRDANEVSGDSGEDGQEEVEDNGEEVEEE